MNISLRQTFASDDDRRGIIECIEVKNFMKHKNLKIELGPHLNFIIVRMLDVISLINHSLMAFHRHLPFTNDIPSAASQGTNGSGKSTILAAIQVALGSNAKTTGRGKNLGELVRRGAPDTAKAIVRVTLKNTG